MMKRKGFSVVMLAVAVATAGFASRAFAQSTLTVDDDGAECPTAGFSTLQDAVDTATAGDTIEVCPGTYGSVDIGKDLTLRGPNAGVSPIDGSRSAEAVITSPGENAIELGNNAELTLDGFTFDDVQRFVLTTNVDGVDAWGNVAIRSNIFQNAASVSGGYFWFRDDGGETFDFQDNLLQDNALSNGLRIRAIPRTSNAGAPLVDVNITDNLWRENEAWALNVNNIEGTVADNQVLGDEATTDILDDQWGFLLATENTDLDVTRNTFEHLVADGVHLGFGFSGTLKITDNSFTGILTEAIDIQAGEDINDTEVHFNSFEDNNVAVENETSAVLDATHNWWGQVTGATSDQTEGDADTRFWCLIEDCTVQRLIHTTGADHVN